MKRSVVCDGGSNSAVDRPLAHIRSPRLLTASVGMTVNVKPRAFGIGRSRAAW
jgi:hypothetical protein